MYKPCTGEDGGEGEATVKSLSNFFTKVNGVKIPKRFLHFHQLYVYEKDEKMISLKWLV